jgi:predicted nucleotidyltransferase
VIDKADVDAIIDLERIARAHGIPMMIIGAGARLLLLDWKHRLPLRRTTKDWDFGVRMKNWPQYEHLHHELTRSDAPFRGTAAEHRLQHTSGTLVDLVPFGEIEAPEGTIQWPQSHVVMSVIGFREADEHAISIELAPGLHVRVVTIPTLVMLKLVAHRDRSKTDDLTDVLFILEHYSRNELEDRIFDELADQLASGELPFELAGSFLLGRDVATQCRPSSRPEVAGILDDLLSDEAPLTHLVAPQLDEEGWQKRFDFITGLFRRFREGFLQNR